MRRSKRYSLGFSLLLLPFLPAANIAFDDHPNDKRFSDRIETVTVDSVFEWLQRAGLGAAPVAFKL